MFKNGRELSDLMCKAGCYTRAGILVLVLLLGSSPHDVRAEAGVVSLDFSKEIQPLLENYCLKCHGPEKPKGGVNLSGFTNVATIHAEPRTWQTVLTQLRERCDAGHATGECGILHELVAAAHGEACACHGEVAGTKQD